MKLDIKSGSWTSPEGRLVHYKEFIVHQPCISGEWISVRKYQSSTTIKYHEGFRYDKFLIKVGSGEGNFSYAWRIFVDKYLYLSGEDLYTLAKIYNNY